MRRAATVLKHFAFYSLLAAAIIKLLAVALAYAALSHRVEIQYWLGKQMGVPVTIQDIGIHWNSYIPRLIIRGLSIGENNALALGDTQIGIHLQALISRRNVIPINISLNGTHIHIRRDTDGNTRIMGISTPGTIENLVLPAYVRIRNAKLTWDDRKRDALITLPAFDLELINLGQKYLLEAQLHTDSGEVSMRANASGNLLSSNWSANTFVSAEAFNASDMFEAYLPDNYELENLVLGLNLWSSWELGKHASSRGEFSIQPFSLNSDDGGSVPIDGLHGAIDYQTTADGWQLQLADFSLTMWQQSWPSSSLLLSQRQLDTGLPIYTFKSEFLRLQDVIEIASLGAVPDQLFEQLLAMDMEADIRDLQISYAAADQPWALAFNFSALNSRPWQRLPGIANFSGNIRANPDHAQLQLNTTNAAVNLKGLFRTPLPLVALNGQIDWLKTEHSWQLFSHSLLAENDHIKTRTRLNLTGSPLFIDLQTNFHDGKVANAGTYYPTGIMPPELVKWLDTALVDGQVTEGAALVYGPLKQFPFHNSHNGHFEVLFDTKDVTLNYQHDWPAIEQLTATTRFHNNQLDIDASHGHVFASKSKRAKVHIPSLKPASRLELEVKAVGPVQDVLRFLTDTPLRDKYASRTKTLTGAGEAEFDFNLQIPLDHSDRYAFNGDLLFKDATLQLTDWDIALDDVNGVLKMESGSFKSSTLTANTLKTPVTINIDPTSHASTLIQTRGNFPVKEILKLAPGLPPLGLTGAADFQVDIDLPSLESSHSKDTLLRISSSLDGIAIDMPEPIGKPVAQHRKLLVEIPIAETVTSMQINYEKAFDLQLQEFNDLGFDIKGTVYKLPLGEWSSYITKLDFGAEKLATPPAFHSLDLLIKNAAMGPIDVDSLNLLANHNDTGWFGYLSSKTIAGSFQIPESGSPNPLTVALDHLNIVHETDTGELASPALDNIKYIDPRSIPALKLSSKRIMFNDALLGSANISAYPTEKGLIFDDIRLEGDLISLHGNGRWTQDMDLPESQTNIEVNIPNLGQLLKKMQLTSQMENASAKLSLRASWPGGPAEFELTRLAGLLDIDIGEGRLLEIDTGAGRVLGLLNLRALQRRLSLDFSDIYQSGLVIDSMIGNFLIEDGNAYTNNLEIIGPTGRINISGRTGLAEEDYDQLVWVTPRIGATLPIAGAVVGGPVAGLAVLLAQTVITKAVPATSKIARIQYSIIGPWDDPVVTRLKRNRDVAKETTPDE